MYLFYTFSLIISSLKAMSLENITLPNHSWTASCENTLKRLRRAAWICLTLAETSELRDPVADQPRGLFLISSAAIFSACKAFNLAGRKGLSPKSV